MKRKMLIFSMFAIFALFTTQNQAYAHSHSGTGAVIAGTFAGIATGLIVGSVVSSSNQHHYYYPKRRYKPYHPHRIGCSCCRQPVYVNTYPSYGYPAYINHRWR